MSDFDSESVSDPFEANIDDDIHEADEIEELDDNGIVFQRRTVLDRSNPLESLRESEFRYLT